jgi:F0F1-type ATP synthase assembly protein I
MQRHKKKFQQHVHHKLSQRMKIYFFISLIMIGVVIYEIVITWYNPLFALWFELLGIIIGIGVARMFHISWNEEEQVVVSRIDQFGGIILWFYLVFSLARHYLISMFISNSFVFVVTFALVSGIMIGRFIGMRNNIFKILKDNDII